MALTASGVLLLLFRPSGDAPVCVDTLRTAAAGAFQHAARQQTGGLIHASLLRIISLPQNASPFGANATLARATRAAVAQWSARLQGLRVQASGLLYVRETQIMSLEGVVHRLPFGERSPAWRTGGRRASLRSPRPMAMMDVLAAGGTRPGYDHDRDDPDRLLLRAAAPQKRAPSAPRAQSLHSVGGRIGIEEDNLTP